VFSLDSVVLLGLFTAAAVALIVHKLLIIVLHGPLPTLGLIAAGPFLFVFDLVFLLFLHHGLSSTTRAIRIISSFVAIFIMSSSAMFVSYYLQANAEVQWGRGVEVHPSDIWLIIQDDCGMEIFWETIGSRERKFWEDICILLPDRCCGRPDETRFGEKFARCGCGVGDIEGKVRNSYDTSAFPPGTIHSVYDRSPGRCHVSS
jgi:hypothetical protein